MTDTHDEPSIYYVCIRKSADGRTFRDLGTIAGSRSASMEMRVHFERTNAGTYYDANPVVGTERVELSGSSFQSAQ